MLQRAFIVIFCGFLLTSCEFFKKREFTPTIAIDTIVDYNSVDIFPLFPSCDSIPSQEKQKICSQIKLSEHIYASLSDYQIVTSEKINDTILVKINIDKTGKTSLLNLQSSAFINEQIPNLRKIISSGVDKIPQLKPAIKRGMPVTTEFTLPIVVKN